MAYFSLATLWMAKIVLETFLPLDYDLVIITAQKMKFFIQDFFSKCDQIRTFVGIWSHLLRKSLMKNFIFCAVYTAYLYLVKQKSHVRLFGIVPRFDHFVIK